ncbi:probable pectinesterase/pectinesterase inhibitor 44 [Vicia villosa]|uniref:probable pectinesterase/pectinesterase inhibitor 44 n=1 Tax=Vicia villosa TaxID=3911 RepID=UPI00273C733D|nr:probable pectinesterase/pectinesterase inhibitor 44 [Vicia villosa]
MEAVNAAPDNSMTRYVISIKKGVYKEKVFINEKKWNITMIGEGMGATVITDNMSCGQNKSFECTYDSATFTVFGPRFIAQDISFMNTAGPENNQALALKSDSDFSAFYRVEISGYQDSLCVNTNRQFYRECKISGTSDFIFGYATAVFQNCTILVRKGKAGQKYTITAQGGYQGIPSGFSFQFCDILADYDFLPLINSSSTFLGRPWKSNARTIFMQSNISNMLNPQGWLEWEGSPEYLDTLFFAEYNNYGPGANTENRVKWSGYHLLNFDQASNFTVANFILGDQWLPSTGIPFTSGLK